MLFHSHESDQNVPSRLWVLPVVGDRTPRPALVADSVGMQGQFSPDGKWISYVSAESGRFEIYVQPFPATGGKWQISNMGGVQPKWRGDGKELFFVAPTGELMVAQVTLAPKFQATESHPLFRLHVPFDSERFQYAVTHDGKRFLAIIGEANAVPLTMMTDFSVDLHGRDAP